MVDKLVAEKIGIYHSCFTDYCGLEYPMFDSKSTVDVNTRRFSKDRTDTYAPDAAPAATATSAAVTGTDDYPTTANPMTDGYGCTAGDVAFGRTCTQIAAAVPASGSTAATPAVNRFKGTVESTQDWCRLHPRNPNEE